MPCTFWAHKNAQNGLVYSMEWILCCTQQIKGLLHLVRKLLCFTMIYWMWVNMLPSLECNKCLHRESNTGPQDDWLYTSVLQYLNWAIKTWHHRSSQFDPKVSIIMLILVRMHSVTVYSILITADHTTGVKCHKNNENMGSNCCVFDESSFVWTWHDASCIMTKEKDTMVYVCAIGSQIIIFKILHVTSTEKLWCVFFYKLFFIVGL